MVVVGQQSWDACVAVFFSASQWVLSEPRSQGTHDADVVLPSSSPLTHPVTQRKRTIADAAATDVSGALCVSCVAHHMWGIMYV